MERNPDSSSAHAAEFAERYAVEGELALRDPEVAAWYAANEPLAREISAGLTTLRAQLAPERGQVTIPSTPRLHTPVPAPSPSAVPRFRVASFSPIVRRVWRSVGLAAVAATAVVIARHMTSRETRAAEEQTFATIAGQTATVTLPQGTRITLAPRSTMRVHQTTVELSGEAYFDVVHTASTPFIVRTGNVTTRVLGTTFGVRRYSDDRETRVAVLTGKVATGAGRQVVITNGAVARVTDSTIVLSREGASDYGAWVNNQLVFRDTPVDDVLTAVGNWSGLRFRVPDSTFGRRRITTSLEIGRRDELLRVLKLTLNATLSFDNGADSVITVRPVPLRGAHTKRSTTTTFSISMEAGR